MPIPVPMPIATPILTLIPRLLLTPIPTPTAWWRRRRRWWRQWGWRYNHIPVFLPRNGLFFAFCFDLIPFFKEEMNLRNEVERKKEKNVRFKLLFKNP